MASEFGRGNNFRSDLYHLIANFYGVFATVKTIH